MKIPYTTDLSAPDGAGSLTILSGFRTQQQASEWSCGVTSVLMVLDWYGALGEHDEAELNDGCFIIATPRQ